MTSPQFLLKATQLSTLPTSGEASTYCACTVMNSCTHFGGENLKRGMTITLEMREIPRNIQESLTLSNARLWMGNMNGCPPLVAILACSIKQ